MWVTLKIKYGAGELGSLFEQHEVQNGKESKMSYLCIWWLFIHLELSTHLALGFLLTLFNKPQKLGHILNLKSCVEHKESANSLDSAGFFASLRSSRGTNNRDVQHPGFVIHRTNFNPMCHWNFNVFLVSWKIILILIAWTEASIFRYITLKL